MGLDSGETKTQFLDDVNVSLERANAFIYSPAIESGVDVTVPVKKAYGLLSCKSNSQGACSQMLSRCRNVIEGRIDVLNDDRFKVNKNESFWMRAEVL